MFRHRRPEFQPLNACLTHHLNHTNNPSHYLVLPVHRYKSFCFSDGAHYTDFKMPVDLPSLKVYNLSTISSGWWYVKVSTNRALNFNGLFSASVQAASLIDFQCNFALFSKGIHPGYIQIDNNPLAGRLRICVIYILGLKKCFDQSILPTLVNVTRVFSNNKRLSRYFKDSANWKKE